MLAGSRNISADRHIQHAHTDLEKMLAVLQNIRGMANSKSQDLHRHKGAVIKGSTAALAHHNLEGRAIEQQQEN